ncbi:MAG: UvrD-helicase domain-containing protein [Treponema sp.]|nr:UvrD-helicase domain-containing protein [Treponema sp.]
MEKNINRPQPAPALQKQRPQLNEEQKKAVYCDENAVVAAGAGSGKTMVLANRFAWLLTKKGFLVEEILTLTFTKKAAAQMFKRIYSLVSEISENEKGIDAERAKKALDDFIKARIQTLDSYCASIVKQCAPRYGISPDFKIDQERCYNLALEISYPFFIAHRHHPAVERLYSDNRPNDIARDIFANVLFNYCHIDKPRDFNADIHIQFNSICAEWKKYYDETKTLLSEIERDILENEGLLPVLVPVMQNIKKEKVKLPEEREIKKYLELLLKTPVDSVIEKSESSPLQESLTNFLFMLNSITSLSLKGGKRSDNPVKDNIKKLREFFNSIVSLCISCMQAGFIISINSLLTELQDIYLAGKRAEGVLTFTDVANLSRTILIEQQDIRQGEKESFKAIMIDEFQDNNELQKDILFLLAEKLDTSSAGIPKAENLCPGKLFFVGDEKQSIYMFRGADVSVFRKLKQEINSSDLPLKLNYRSVPRLIGAFNAIFGGSNFDSMGKSELSVFPSVFAPPESLPLYEAGYSTLEAGKINEEKKSGGNLTICILNKKNDSDDEKDDFLPADESEARFTAEKIKSLLADNYKPGDIAVLFRTRSSQYLYEKHLRAINIPYSCEDINDLFYGGPVNDIMSVLRLAANPMDKMAYAEMLRSPFAGLSLSGTAVCLSIYCNVKEKNEPFDDKPLPHLEESDKTQYICGQKIYSKIRAKAESRSISSLVSELWYNEGYRYETEWNPQTNAYSELFDYLFHLAANADADNKSLASFTDSMISFRNEGGQLSDIEIPLERPGAVHLMTIHKSKGLEFPVVFLSGCGKKSQSDRCDAVYLSDTAGIVFSPPAPQKCRSITGKRNNFFWEQANEETKRKRTAELRRLLYVGMTRAEKELYLTGSLEIKEEDNQDDFPSLIKNYTEEKCGKNENKIDGDSILNNDTLFGLLLPAIAAHIPSDGLKSTSSFFNIEEIKSLSQDEIKNEESKNTGYKNNKKSLNEFIKKKINFYEKAKKIKTPVVYDNHITPVSLRRNEGDSGDKETLGRGIWINKEFSGVKSDDVFENVDSMLSRFSQNGDETSEKFNSGSFGTIAHICVEAHLNKEEPALPSNISCLLNPSESVSLIEAGSELARRFVLSPLGKIAENANFRESEFPFRSIMKNRKGKEIFINGTVDLFFEDNDSIHIVDFKTDSNEKPAEHTAQMSCYYRAIHTLFGLPLKKQCRIWLYYLRTGHAVEMTEKANQYDLEKRAFDNDKY